MEKLSESNPSYRDYRLKLAFEFAPGLAHISVSLRSLRSVAAIPVSMSQASSHLFAPFVPFRGHSRLILARLGFNPGYSVKKAPPEGAVGWCLVLQEFIKQTVDHKYLSPLQGGRYMGGYPALKLRAESSSPSGTKARQASIEAAGTYDRSCYFSC